MKNVILTFFIIHSSLFTIHCSAQKQGQELVDSLQTALKNNTVDDTLKVNILNSLSRGLWQTGDYIKAKQYSDDAIVISEKIDFKKGTANAYNNMGNIYFIQGDYADALKNYITALKVREEIGDKQGVASSYGNIGLIYYRQGNYPEGLKNHFAALKIDEELGDKQGIAADYLNIGVIYIDQGNYPDALKNYLAALKIYKEIGDKIEIAACYNNIGVIYVNQGNYPDALKNYLTALKIREEIGDKNGVATSYSNIGVVYYSQGNYADALKNYFAALKIEEELNDKNGMASSYINIGTINTVLKKFREAKKYFYNGLSLSKEIGAKENIKEGYRNLTVLDSTTANWQDAYLHYKSYILYRDSLVNEENTKKTVQTQMQYEFDKKETLAKAEQKGKDAISERTRNLQYVAISAFGLLGIFLLYGYTQKNKAKKKIEIAYIRLQTTQKQLIQSEKMASLGELTAGIAHEIQNPLNFVNNFSEVNKEMVDEATEEIDKRNYDGVKIILNDIKGNSEKINHHGKRADSIVKGMLEHSRTSTGLKEPTDLNKLADEYLRLAYHGLRAKDKEFNADIKTEFDELIGRINIIPQDIGRVLLNLYNNAFYAVSKPPSPKGEQYKPLVIVTTRKIKPENTNAAKNTPLGDGGIEICVTDNGNGIPSNIIDKIFQPFFTTKPTGQGTGLGLSLAYDIIKAHGGEIKVETKEGEGTAFIVFLPVS